MVHRKKPVTAAAILAFAAVSAFPTHHAHALSFGGKKRKVVDDGITERKLTPSQNALIDKAIIREKATIEAVKKRTPLVETYIQTDKPDPVFEQVPTSDDHFLGRVDFGKIIGDDSYDTKPEKGGILKQSVSLLSTIGDSLHLQFSEEGFVQMLLVDSNNFDRQHYKFTYVHSEWLGTVPTAIFEVTPIGGSDVITGADKKRGRFVGRIWIETRGGNIVRFNGDFAGTEAEQREFYHFDSWRTNVQPDLWLPTSFYVEQSDPKSKTNTLKFKASGRIWGYQLTIPPDNGDDTDDLTATSLDVVGATDVSNDAPDVSVRGAQREWVQQAEDNVVDRLYKAGLLDAPSPFDKTLEAIAANILAYNGITPTGPIRVRTLLTYPLESTSFGNTILISKSLLDTTGIVSQDGAQQMGNIEGILAFQLAHIILGHRMDTKYAFSNHLLFPSTSVFERIPMHHTDADNEEAAKKAMQLLSAKELVGSQQYFGLYLQQLQERIKALKALNEPMIGDGLIKSDSDPTFWMAAMLPKAPKLEDKDINQQAAMPLDSFTRSDPWTDKVNVLHAAYVPLVNPADKMPFEVGPVYIKLAYYKDPAAAATPAAAASAPQDGGNGNGDNSAAAVSPAPAAN